MSFYKKTKNGFLLSLRIVPNSSINKIAEIMQDALKIKLKAPPVEGAANKELIKFLSKLLKVSKSDIVIKKGETSKNKEIEISNQTIESELKKWINSTI